MNTSKIKNYIVVMSLLLIAMSSCKDDDQAPKVVPTVTTGAISNVTVNSVTLSGKITDNGNDEITKAGFVYSSNVGEPTTADNKVELSVTSGDLTAALINLASGTTYHVRAFATNSVGTGYGAVVDVQTSNQAPSASGVAISGSTEVGKTLSASYTYTDAENDDESGSIYKWYRANSAAGEGEAAIDGATTLNYTLVDTDQGKFIRFGVTPKALAGETTGTEMKSDYTVAIGAETVTFSYAGQNVTFGVITSEKTQRKWLDRNLGATRVAQSVSDYVAYGDLFQWGRRSDGHQGINRTDATESGSTGVTGTTSTPSDIDVPITDKFILGDFNVSFDWRNPQNDKLWQGVNGTNNPCPGGWRLATLEEWTAEDITDINDAYAKLKLTYTGFRQVDASFNNITIGGYYWTSTVQEEDPNSMRVRWNSSSFLSASSNRSIGQACRCTKD